MHDINSAISSQSFVPFHVQYAGVVSEIWASSVLHDDTSRTDLLRLIDIGRRNGKVTAISYQGDNAVLELNNCGVRVKECKTSSLILACPVQMLASVGHISEDGVDIVAFKFADSPDCETCHHCILYVENKAAAEHICQAFEKCFTMAHLEFAVETAAQHSPGYRFNGNSNNRQPVSLSASPSAQSSSSPSLKGLTELVNEYLSLLTSQLSIDEVRQFWALFKPATTGHMPIAEACQKMLELIGNDRKHLLARMGPFIKSNEQASFNAFLEQNGISDNAACSLPSWSPASIEAGQSLDMSMLNVLTPPIKKAYYNEPSHNQETKM